MVSIKENMQVIGDFSMKIRNTETGEVIDTFEEKNIVVDQGKDLLLRAFTVRDTNDFVVNTIKIGSDVGVGGTVLAPTMPTVATTEADQTVLYTVPVDEFFITYPEPKKVNFFATINGAAVMALFPTQPNVVYTSAGLYLLNDKVFAYKRFAGRTISNILSIDISWTITVN